MQKKWLYCHDNTKIGTHSLCWISQLMQIKNSGMTYGYHDLSAKSVKQLAYPTVTDIKPTAVRMLVNQLTLKKILNSTTKSPPPETPNSQPENMFLKRNIPKLRTTSSWQMNTLETNADPYVDKTNRKIRILRQLNVVLNWLTKYG